MLRHAVRDIRGKGATRHYNTKPNEKMHGPLKKIYLRRTNFKDVENQVYYFVLFIGGTDTNLA